MPDPVSEIRLLTADSVENIRKLQNQLIEMMGIQESVVTVTKKLVQEQTDSEKALYEYTTKIKGFNEAGNAVTVTFSTLNGVLSKYNATVAETVNDTKVVSDALEALRIKQLAEAEAMLSRGDKIASAAAKILNSVRLEVDARDAALAASIASIAAEKLAVQERVAANIAACEAEANAIKAKAIAYNLASAKVIASLQSEAAARKVAEANASAAWNAVGQVRTGFAVVGTTPGEMLNYNTQLASLQVFIDKNRQMANALPAMWRDVSEGISHPYVDKMREMQSILFAVRKAQEQLGATSVTEQAKVKVAVTKTNTELGIQTQKTNEVAKATDGLTLSWSSIVRIIAGQVIRSGFYYVADGIRQSIGNAKELHLAIARIQTIGLDAQLSTREWASGLRQLSDAFGLPILEQAAAAYNAISNQVTKGAETFQFLAEANKFAIVTVTSVDNAVNLLSSSLNAYGGTIADVHQRSALFYKIIDLGRVKAEEIANSWGTIAAMGSQLSVTEEELGAALATITNRGVKTSVAMTQLRGIMLELQKPSQGMKEMFAQLGVATGEQAIQTYTLAGFLDLVSEKVKGSSSELAKMFNEMRGLQGATTLTGSGLKTFQQSLIEFQNAQVDYNRAIEVSMDNAGRQTEQFIQRLKNAFTVDIGQNVIETITSFTKLIGPSFFNSTVEGIKIIAAVMLVSLVPAIEKVAKALFTLQKLNPITAALYAAVLIKSLADTWLSHLDRMERATEEAANKVREHEVEIRQTYADESRKLNDIIDANSRKYLQIIAEATAKETKYIDEKVEKYKEMSLELKEVTKDIRQSFSDMITSLNKDISDYSKEAENAGTNIRKIIEDTNVLLREQQLESYDVGDQLVLMQQHMREALADANKAAGIAGNSKIVAENIKIAEDYQKRIIKLQEDTDKKNEETQKHRQKLLIDAVKAEVKFRNDMTSLASQIADAQGRGDAKKVADLKRKMADLFSDKELKMDDINRQLQELVVVEFQRVKAAELYNATRTKEIEINQKVAASALKAEKEKIEKLAEFERLQDKISILTKQIEVFKPEDLEKLDTTEKVNTAVQKQIGLMEELRKLSNDDRLIKKITSDEVAKILEAEKNITENGIARNRKIDYAKMTKDIENQTDALRKQMIEISKQRANVAILDNATSTIIDRVKESIQKPLLTGNVLDKENLKKLLADYAKLPIEEQQKRIPSIIASLNTLIAAQKEWARGVAAGEIVRGWPQPEIKDIETLNIDYQELILKLERQLKAYRANNSELERTQKQYDDLKEAIRSFETTTQTSTQAAISITHTYTEEINAASAAYNRLIELQGKYKYFIENPSFPQSAIPKAGGGFIGTDRIHAMLSPGEFIMNAKSTKQYFSQLVAMNSGRGYASGGMVTNVGDINISLQPTGNESLDVIRIGKLLKREIRRGTLRF